MKTSRPADFKSVPGFENQPRFVGVIEQNKISQTFFHYCMYESYLLKYQISVETLLSKCTTTTTTFQAQVQGIADLMFKDLREKLKTHKESQKGSRADTIIQMHCPPTHA